MRELFAQRGYNLLSTEYKNNKSPVIFEKNGYKYQNTYNGFIKTDNIKLLRIPYWEYRDNKYKQTLKTSTAKI